MENKKNILSIEKLAWAKANKIYNEEATLLIMEKIGRWDSAEFVRSESNWVGTGYRTYYYRLKQGEKTFDAWVKITGYYGGEETFCWDVCELDLAAEKAARREYYLKVKSLADEAGVPWEIASLLEDKDGNRRTNLMALAEARAIHFSQLDEETIHELRCGIARRKGEIHSLLFWADQFDLRGQIKSSRLAYYLIGNQE